MLQKIVSNNKKQLKNSHENEGSDLLTTVPAFPL